MTQLHLDAPARLTFDVFGEPQPEGSMKAFNDAYGKPRLTPSGGSKFARWRNAVAEAARVQADQLCGPLSGPMRLSVDFRFDMPPSTIKRADRLAGRRWKLTTPDTDKLVRAVGDALSAVKLVADDKLFVEVVARKYEVIGAWTGARITIEVLA